MTKFKLTAKEWQDVEISMREEGGELSFLEYYAAQQAEHLPCIFKNSQRRYEHFTEEQRVADATAHLMRQFLLSRGYAKRLSEDAPQELAYSASLFARLECWNGVVDLTDSLLHHARELMPALSAGDIGFVQRYAEVMPHRLTSGQEDLRLIHTGVIATVLRDDELLKAALADFQAWKKPKQYSMYMAAIFRGLLKRDGGMVTQGLNDLLKTSRKIWQLLSIYKLISLETHGMYELCRWFQPQLVASFDTSRSLPWDQGLCEWVQANEGKPTFYDVSSLSPTLQRWLVELPFRADRKHYWTREEAETSSSKNTAETTDIESPPTSASQFDKSWQVMLVKHRDPKNERQFNLAETIFSGDTPPNSLGTVLHIDRLQANDFTAPRGPWAICIKFKRKPWSLVAGALVTDEWVKKIGKRKRTQAIHCGFKADTETTYCRYYEDGKVAVDFEAVGPPCQASKRVKLKSTVPLDDCCSGEIIPAKALDALLSHFDARMLLEISQEQGKLGLRSLADGKQPKLAFEEAMIAEFYSLREGENPASDRLAAALDDADPAKVKQAIELGADLAWLPSSFLSPLRSVLGKQQGDWRACAQALVEAGAPVDGYPGESPPLSDFLAISSMGDTEGLGQLQTVEVIDTMLSLGANINAIDSTNNGNGNSPLHHAVANCLPLVVVHLLSRGVNATITNRDGQTARQLARNCAEKYHADWKLKSKKIVKLLTEWESGKLTPAKLRAAITQEQKVVQEALQQEFWRRAAKLVLLQSERIEIKRVTDFGEPPQAKMLVADFEGSGFQKFGYFTVRTDLLKLRVINFHHPKRRIYGSVVIHKPKAFMNLTRFHKDGTITSVSNAELTTDFSSQAKSLQDLPVRHWVVPDGNIDALLSKLDEIPIPQAGLEPVSPEDFEERMKRHHELDFAGQMRVAKRILGKA